MKTRKLCAALAVRNQGSRLYGKPLQNLDVSSGVKIIDNVIDCLRSIECIENIVLGIARGTDERVYTEYANCNDLPYIIGDEIDVLSRLIQCGQSVGASDIFRVTSESPFPSFDKISDAWRTHRKCNADATFYDDVVDGCGFEIIKLDALIVSHDLGAPKHRSELCTLYIREHIKDFVVKKIDAPKSFKRFDLRLTVDNPEDLIVCKAVYNRFRHLAPKIPLDQIIGFLEENKELTALTQPFTQLGYSSMYKWE